MFQPDAFNPLDYSSLSDSIARALMASDLVPLAEVEEFCGSGIYALFYTGDFPAYGRLANSNGETAGSWPIYVGKAAPSARKGGEGGADPAEALPEALFSGSRLFQRVRHHRQSIQCARNLEVADFQVRLLVLSYIWVPLAETAMIAQYRPIWNAVVDGFGNHAPGRGRAAGVRPRWDTLHPGRDWADVLPERGESAEQISQDVIQVLDESMS